MQADFDVFCGVDVGKGKHHVCALNRSGKKIFNRQVPNDEANLRSVFSELAKHGAVQVVVDQVSSIAVLAIAVARSMGLSVAYLPGLTMRRLADLHPGQDKTDARDAFVIADAGRTLPHTLRRVGRDNDVDVELQVLAGFDEDLAAESTRIASRLRDVLLHVHPALERLLGPNLDRFSVLNILGAAPTPEALRELGADGIRELIPPTSTNRRSLPGKILAALDEQTVQVPGVAEFGRVIRSLAHRLLEVRRERQDVEATLKAKLDHHPVAPIMTSLPGIGPRGAARLIVTIGDGSAFPTADHLAAFAGLAPVTRQSGSSINGQRQTRRGNRMVKNVFFYAAMISITSDPASKDYYQRKRDQGKRRTAALVALARRKVTVLHAMLRTRTTYESRPPRNAAPDMEMQLARGNELHSLDRLVAA